VEANPLSASLMDLGLYVHLKAAMIAVVPVVFFLLAGAAEAAARPHGPGWPLRTVLLLGTGAAAVQFLAVANNLWVILTMDLP